MSELLQQLVAPVLSWINGKVVWQQESTPQVIRLGFRLNPLDLYHAFIWLDADIIGAIEDKDLLMLHYLRFLDYMRGSRA
jgi:hypothetical protein